MLLIVLGTVRVPLQAFFFFFEGTANETCNNLEQFVVIQFSSNGKSALLEVIIFKYQVKHANTKFSSYLKAVNGQGTVIHTLVARVTSHAVFSCSAFTRPPSSLLQLTIATMNLSFSREDGYKICSQRDHQSRQELFEVTLQRSDQCTKHTLLRSHQQELS